MISIAICDDVELDRKQLCDAIEALARELDRPCTIDCFSDGASLLAALESHSYTALFLDIFMDEMDGVTLARSLPESYQTFIIFTTTSPDFALDAIGLNAVHYLLKPVTRDGLLEVYRRCTARLSAQPEAVLEITVDRQLTPLLQREIQYIEANNKTSLIHTRDQCYKTYEPIHKLMERLDGALFLAPQRSFIVNMDFIDRFQKTRLILKNGQEITVGRQLRNDVAKRYTEYLASIIRRMEG